MTTVHTQKWTNIWIVGASSGIGRALAVRFADRGCTVTVSARRSEALEALAFDHPLIQPLALDVSDPEAVKEAVAQMEEAGRLPDLTIYCAAIYQPGGVDILTHKAAAEHMQVNYLGAVALLEGLLPGLQQRGTGKVAIVSSLTSYCGLPKAALYGPTKAALASLCETLRPEFEQMGLGLTLINPGFVATRLTDKNDFGMPFLMTEDAAADAILHGLDSDRFEIAFPLRMAWLLRLLKWLPYGAYFYLMRRMLK